MDDNLLVSVKGVMTAYYRETLYALPGHPLTDKANSDRVAASKPYPAAVDRTVGRHR